LTGIESRAFAENQLQLSKFRSTHEGQFQLITHLEFQEV
jgi:hypothetical protein